MPRETAAPEGMPLADELARFNDERRRLLTEVAQNGRERVRYVSDRRLPIGYSGRGGDVAPPSGREW